MELFRYYRNSAINGTTVNMNSFMDVAYTDIAYGRLYGRCLYGATSLIWTDVAYMDGRCLYVHIKLTKYIHSKNAFKIVLARLEAEIINFLCFDYISNVCPYNRRPSI